MLLISHLHSGKYPHELHEFFFKDQIAARVDLFASLEAGCAFYRTTSLCQQLIFKFCFDFQLFSELQISSFDSPFVQRGAHYKDLTCCVNRFLKLFSRSLNFQKIRFKFNNLDLKSASLWGRIIEIWTFCASTFCKYFTKSLKWRFFTHSL